MRGLPTQWGRADESGEEAEAGSNGGPVGIGTDRGCESNESTAMGVGAATGADNSVGDALTNPIAVGAAIPESSTGASDGRGPSGAVGKSDTT